jgi:isopenicillin-N N-acyltransferase-like protein
MNAEGLSIVVHGGRARDTRAEGEPVVHTARALLSEARTVDEALAILERKAPMVSHILLLADAIRRVGRGSSVRPGEPPFARRAEGPVLPLTNHFEGPCAADPKNQKVREKHLDRAASRAARRALVEARQDRRARRAVDILRDKRGPGDADLPLGHRSSLDALIATHAVVMDSTDRVLWVSEGPHLMGQFVRFDLKRLLDPAYEPDPREAVVTLPPDPLKLDGGYDKWLEAGSPHHGGRMSPSDENACLEALQALYREIRRGLREHELPFVERVLPVRAHGP